MWTDLIIELHCNSGPSTESPSIPSYNAILHLHPPSGQLHARALCTSRKRKPLFWLFFVHVSVPVHATPFSA